MLFWQLRKGQKEKFDNVLVEKGKFRRIVSMWSCWWCRVLLIDVINQSLFLHEQICSKMFKQLTITKESLISQYFAPPYQHRQRKKIPERIAQGCIELWLFVSQNLNKSRIKRKGRSSYSSYWEFSAHRKIDQSKAIERWLLEHFIKRVYENIWRFIHSSSLYVN